VESLEKPVVDRVMQAMALAYPDSVDIVLLSMVLGCDAGAAREAMAGLVADGLAQGTPDHPCITDRGMAVALGLAKDADDAAALLDRLEAQTLRALLAMRVRGSRLAPLQSAELSASLLAVPDGALVDAARVWAHQPVSDWRALIRILLGQGTELAPAVAG
jgi:hypothetical protein